MLNLQEMKKLHSLMEDEEIYEGGYHSRTSAIVEDDEEMRKPVRMLDISQKMKTGSAFGCTLKNDQYISLKDDSLNFFLTRREYVKNQKLLSIPLSYIKEIKKDGLLVTLKLKRSV